MSTTAMHTKAISNAAAKLAKLAVAAVALQASAAMAGIDSGPAPDFTLPTNSGENLRLAEQQGNVVMLNFWASWCAPCREEMPHLNAIDAEYGELGFELLGINVDKDRKAADRAIKKLKVQFPVLFDSNNDIADLFNVDAMPTTIIIDRDGNVQHLHRGYKKGYENDYREQVGSLVMQ